MAEVTDRLYELCAAFYGVLKAYLAQSQSSAGAGEGEGGLDTDGIPQTNMEAALPAQMNWMQPLYGAEEGRLQWGQMPSLENWGDWPADDLFWQPI